MAKPLNYKGYKIPSDLAILTGGGIDDWDKITNYHKMIIQKYAPITRDMSVMEIGCGVGRDAITLTEMLSNRGKYIGIDIIYNSIKWCQDNITPKNANFHFYYLDIKSQIHNPGGKLKTTDIDLPAPDKSIDRILLFSVFTHMFEEDIVHYLREFYRVLKPNGLIVATFFVIDDKVLVSLAKGGGLKGRHPLSFKFKYSKDCYINDRNYPEGAVGYTANALKRMFFKSKLRIADGFIHRGNWSGAEEHAANSQDVIVLEKSPSFFDSLDRLTSPLRFTND